MRSSLLSWVSEISKPIKRISLHYLSRIRTWSFALPVLAALLLEPGISFRIISFIQEDEGNSPEPLLLPDLKTLPPTDLRLVINPDTEGKSIRFSNQILNLGPGILQMSGEFNSETEVVTVTQVMLGNDFSKTERETGVFYYHDEHSHWHWEGFSQYTIWSVTPSGGLGKDLASNDKVGYCLEDVELFDGNQALLHLSDDESPPVEPQFTSCYWRRQGLSIGWVDIYRSHIPGQSIAITHLTNGVYALQSTVDPANLIWEENDANNTAIVYFSLQDNRIDVLKSPPTPLSSRVSPE